MPPVKLIIQKQDEAKNCKFLQIIIEDGHFPQNVLFGKWTDGTIETNKENSKSPCLIVKIVSTLETDVLNIETNAKLLEQGSLHEYLLLSIDCPLNQTNSNDINIECHENNKTCSSTNITRKDYINPLQYSLDRVNENNARIMENIKMLNRTLDMTKSQEYFKRIFKKSIRYPSCNDNMDYIQDIFMRRNFNLQQINSDYNTQQRWQVVWTCIQCFQVWPHRDLAINHVGNSCKPKNLNQIREIKTSSLLQCEFCEKVFTCIPRLLRHSKSHTVVNNYECSTCSLAFLSFKSNEQHWLICPWLKLYSFELPKLLLCNICDRKFKNYDQLYNHRYKAEHFIQKIFQDGVRQSVDALVHQCELCGLCSQTISELKDHKVQVHKQLVF